VNRGRKWYECLICDGFNVRYSVRDGLRCLRRYPTVSELYGERYCILCQLLWCNDSVFETGFEERCLGKILQTSLPLVFLRCTRVFENGENGGRVFLVTADAAMSRLFVMGRNDNRMPSEDTSIDSNTVTHDHLHPCTTPHTATYGTHL